MSDVPAMNNRRAVDKELADLERRYHDLMHRNPAGIFRTSLDGRIIECNDSMARILGYGDHAELMRHSALELYHASRDREHYLEKLIASGELINFELTMRHRTGRDVHVLENVFIDRTPGHEPTIMGMFVDITDRKRAESERQAQAKSFRDLVEHMHDGLMVTVEGIVHYANPAAKALLDDDLEGSRLEDHFVQEDRAALSDISDHQAPIRARSMHRMERELQLRRTMTSIHGRPAVQFTLLDQQQQQNLIRDRLKLQLAEEVNKVLRDEIAGHRKTQAQLQQSRRFARSLIDSSLDMIMAGDEHGRITEYNPAASLRFGYEAHEVMGRETRMLYAEPEVFDRVQTELETHGAFAGEVRNIDKYGNVFTSYLAASRLYDEDGRVIGAMGVSRDISRMKRDQEALRASEERYRDLFENATDLIQSVDMDGRFEYVNNAWRSTLGYTREDISALSIWDVIETSHLEECRAFLDAVMKGTSSGTIRTVFRAKDGRPVTVEGTVNVRRVNDEPVATRSIFRDITHVEKAKQQVLEHEAKLRALFESSEHMFWTIAPDLRLISFNKGYGDMVERLHGKRPQVSAEDSAPRPRFASDAYHAFWEEKYAIAFSGQAIRFETDLLDARGERVCNEVFLSPVFGSEGAVVEVFGIGHEITEQKVAEDKVREQAARLRAIFESSGNMMIWTLDKEMRITSCNAHFQRSVEEAHGIRLRVGDSFSEALAPRVRPGTSKALLSRYTAALRGQPQQFEVELIDVDGQQAWVENFLNPIIVDGVVREVSCLAHGITDRKRSQRELEASLAEKEVLLKEVHHRVKNNLQVISSITKLQTERAETDPKVLEVLRHSRDRIRSMALIHDSLYQNKQFSHIDLAEYIEGLARNLMLSYSTSERIRLELDLEAVHLNIDQAMPCGLVLNEIISNALKHGFPDGREGVVSVGLKLEDERVRITVADDGAGLPQGFVDERDGHLGMELIRLLVGQLDGEVKRGAGIGVSYFITFERLKNNGYGADERSRGRG